MEDMRTEENIEKMLREVFKPEALSTDCKNPLLKDLILTASGNMKTSNKSLWKKPDLWVAVAAVVILAVIGYGIWVPYSVWNKLTS